METKNVTTSSVQCNQENLEQKYSYVLHGAQAICEYGTRPARLTIPYGHGTEMHGMPVMTVEDCMPFTNVKAFGYCTSKDNPDIFTEMDRILEAVEKEDIDSIANPSESPITNIFDRVLSVFGGPKKDPNKSLSDYGEDLVNSVTIMCKPAIAWGDTWSGGTDRLLINGKQALNSSCTLVCTKCGGRITIIDDGQENAINLHAGKGGGNNGNNLPGSPVRLSV